MERWPGPPGAASGWGPLPRGSHLAEGLPVHPVPRPGGQGHPRTPGPPGPRPVAGGDGGGCVQCLLLAEEAEHVEGEAAWREAEEEEGGGGGESQEAHGTGQGGAGVQELGRVPEDHGEEEEEGEQEERQQTCAPLGERRHPPPRPQAGHFHG